MLLRKRLRAGILLYALLMAAIFSLFLQFYLDRVIASQRQSQAQLRASQAYLLAQWTSQLVTDESGQLTYEQGRVSYHKEAGKLQLEVLLSDGQAYTYGLRLADETAPETPVQDSQSPAAPE